MRRFVQGILQHHDAHQLALYHRALAASYIEHNSRVRWCTSAPCCGGAIEALDEAYGEPVCACGHTFCFTCGEAPHTPATCQMWREWDSQLTSGGETESASKLYLTV